MSSLSDRRIPLAHGDIMGRIVRVYTNGDIEDYQTGELIENIGREITPLDVYNWFGIKME